MLKPDNPIMSTQEDLLERAAFSRSLAQAILAYGEKESIVTALYGDWGSGKTSVINMVLESIELKAQKQDKSQKPIIVHFNPWNYSDQNHLVALFFKELSFALRREDHGKQAKEIGEKLEAYSNFFTPLALIPEPSVSLVMLLLQKVFKGVGKSAKAWGAAYSKDLDATRKELDRLLAAQNQKILIIIDDIDRLTNEEIRQIFQLVKMLGNFPNTFYLLAFDRNVVVNALRKVQEGSGEEYLEKIVQIPFELPKISSQEVQQLLFTKLDELIKPIPQEDFDQTYWGNVYHGGLKNFFGNIRDVTRYVNSLRFGFSMVKDEVNPIDFLAITAIQVFEPSVYLGLRDNIAVFTGVIESSYGRSDSQKESIKVCCDEILLRALVLDKERLLGLLKRLFPKLESVYGNVHYGHGTIQSWRREKRVCSPENFDTFFSLSVPKGEMSPKEIKAILEIAGDKKVFSDMLLSLSKEGRVLRFLERMEDYTAESIPEEHIAPIINVLINIGDQFPEGPKGMFSTDTPMRILRLTYQLSKRYKDQNKRFEILRDAIVGAEDSLFTIVHEVTILGQHHGKLTSNKEEELEPVEEKPVGVDHLGELEKLAYEKIKQWAADGRLKEHPMLTSILYSWKRWTKDSEEISEYIESLLETDAGLIGLINAFVYQSFTQSVSDLVGKVKYAIDLKNVARLVPIEKLEPRAREILKGKTYKELDEEHQRALQIFIDTVDGKTEDWR